MRAGVMRPFVGRKVKAGVQRRGRETGRGRRQAMKGMGGVLWSFRTQGKGGGQRRVWGRVYISDANWLKIWRQIPQSHRWSLRILRNGPEQQWWWQWDLWIQPDHLFTYTPSTLDYLISYAFYKVVTRLPLFKDTHFYLWGVSYHPRDWAVSSLGTSVLSGNTYEKLNNNFQNRDVWLKSSGWQRSVEDHGCRQRPVSLSLGSFRATLRKLFLLEFLL